MPQFNIGDELVYPRGAHPDIIYTVSGIVGGQYILRRGDRGSNGSLYSFFTVHAALELKEPANPNHITVSSLDYMTSTELTNEDKLIIMEHLEHA